MIIFENDEEFISNYEKLKSSRKMGILYHCDRKTITAHAKKIGYDYSKHKERKISTANPEVVISLYKELGSCEKVGEHFNCSATAVNNYLKKIGYFLNPPGKLSKISDEEIISLYKKLQSAEKVGEKLSCSGTAILQRLHKIGYDIEGNKTYKLSKEDKQVIINSYFDKTSQELAKQYQVSRGMITKVWYDAGLLNKQIKTENTTEINLIGQRFGKWTVLAKSNKRGVSGIIYWHCRCDCGQERDISGLSLRNGTSLSCGAHSNISKGNEKIKKILQKTKIPFELEKKFDTCRDINPLPFDFYINNEYLVEYDGVQHFQKSIFDYEYTHRHDQIKTEWCRKNNVPLIRIPYTQFDNLCLEDLLLNTSNFIEIMPTLNRTKSGESA